MSLVMCVMNVPCLSSPYLAVSVSASPKISPPRRLSFPIAHQPTPWCVCVCVVCASSARHQPAWHKHFLVLALARIPPSPQTQIPQSLSLYISYFLPLVHPTRSFLGPVRKGEISVACLGWVDLWGGSWGPGGEKELLASLPGWSERSTLLYFLSFTRRNNNAPVDKRLGRA